MTDPKPYWVERQFAEHRGALQAFFRRRIRSKVEAPDLAQDIGKSASAVRLGLQPAPVTLALPRLRALFHELLV